MRLMLRLFSHFHMSAALALATIGVVAAPEDAWAYDPLQDCANKCKDDFGVDNWAYWTCVGNCCNHDAQCCQTHTFGTDPNRFANCQAARGAATCSTTDRNCNIYSTRGDCFGACQHSAPGCGCQWYDRPSRGTFNCICDPPN